ncbi:PEPxxWA-CTERM sorting domain-containing protein [Roseateles toxinivorans]|uniref:Putative secreted protein with PEP-CTERM sorting signal/MYXO-CTERM domain-containing protein n=1 Tax=Roseateles toxinivorans TaxID=270368 RepID=A0A4R6QMG8_9BURK|nr:PEPxxWA-CTERM sorting domain-containing protein [Roseateles toxinivorans]TDP71523.1 putative secreted protein with PEP-CTERM sorting signal/MYXO-CTERM domain-containing protein [Roseateles toxinivorans]
MMRSSSLAVALALLASTLPTAQAATTIVPQSEWGDMQFVAGTNNASNELIYEFSVAPDQGLTVSSSFTTSSYAPGPYEPGFVSPGWLFVRRSCTACGAEGNVIWDMGKPYTANFNNAYTMILIGDLGRGTEVADYVPGATYQTTMTWNRASSKIDINVSGPGLNVTRQVDSSGDTITGLVFRGPNYEGMGASLFGNVSVITQAVPEPETWAMLLAGLGLLGAVAKRREQASSLGA